MAKKTRVPMPPAPGRSTQFPQRRATPPRTPPVSRRQLIVGAAALAAVAIAFAAAAALRGGDASTAEIMREAGCRYDVLAAREAPHVPPTAKVEYNSFPPTNGPMANELIVWGAYDEPVVGQRQLVHNLEHGGVAIQYGSKVDATTIAQIEDLYQKSPNALVVAPLPALGERIALTAWNAPDPDAAVEGKDLGRGILARCTRFDERAFAAFIDAHRYKGPERMGRESLEPGQ